MPFGIDAFVARWPFAYHLTSSENVQRIRSTGRLETAAALMERAGCLEWLRVKRSEHVEVVVNGAAVMLRDQKPLYERNVLWADGWQLGDLVEALNRRVFFWPGGISGPRDHGRRHFERYRDEGPVILRAPILDLLSCNPGMIPMFCAFNSGSPRWSGGQASPRGMDTFVGAERFPRRVSEVVELTFAGGVDLPNMTEVSRSVDGPWALLGTDAFTVRETA